MNREIKFRVWDNEEKRWCHHGRREGGWEWCNLLSDGEVVYGIDDEVFEPDHRDRHTVELYTGLKDKNGKEIYEGDIVKEISTGELGVVYYAAPSFIVSNKYSDYYALGAGKAYPEDDNQLKDTVVIGNVHENPELLEDKS